MKRFATTIPFLLALGIAWSGAAVAQELPPAGDDAATRLEASPRHGEWVAYEAGSGDSVKAWVVYPERSDGAPVVVVIHEIFGLTDWIRTVADQLAAHGFIAIAPDLLSGKGPGGGGTDAFEQGDVRRAVSGLERAEVFRRLDAAARYATALPAATDRYGVIGFCWGGSTSFAYATHQPALGAAVVYYGGSPDSAALASVHAPVLGLYGGDDARVNATVPAAEREMQRLGKRYLVRTYEGAGHGFLRAQGGREGANLRASQQAWPETVAFLREALGR